MKKNRQVYIITEKIGHGHKSVSDALEEILKEQFNVIIIDYFSLIGENIDRSIGSIYGYLISNFPYLYKLVYSLIDRQDSTKLMDMMIAQRLKNKIGSGIEDSILISTFPNPTIALSYIKAYRKYSIITDYFAHSGWITKKIDGYFVANKEIKDRLYKSGVEKEKIHITGIPIRQKFYKDINIKEIKNNLGINNTKKTILILGGGDGVIQDAKYIISLFENKYNIIIITAKNKNLRNSLEKNANKNTKVLGYVDNIEEIMSISDLAITKAGGLSLSELNLKRVPIIIYKTIPGQETENTKYFIKNNACIEINDKEKLKITANNILSGKIKVDGKIINKRYPATLKIINIIQKEL